MLRKSIASTLAILAIGLVGLTSFTCGRPQPYNEAPLSRIYLDSQHPATIITDQYSHIGVQFEHGKLIFFHNEERNIPVRVWPATDPDGPGNIYFVGPGGHEVTVGPGGGHTALHHDYYGGAPAPGPY